MKINLTEEAIKKVVYLNKVNGENITDEQISEDILSSSLENTLFTLDLLINNTKQELKDYFTTDEAFEIVASFSSTIYGLGIDCKTFLVDQVTSHFKYEIPCTCTDKDSIKRLEEKLQKLNELQAYTVYFMAKEYLLREELFDENSDMLKKVFLISK